MDKAQRRLRVGIAVVLACLLGLPAGRAAGQSCSPPMSCSTAPGPGRPAPAPAQAPIDEAKARAIAIDIMRNAYASGSYKLAFDVARGLHRDGVPEGATMLGQISEEGRLAPPDFDQAAEFYGDAIKKNFAEAMRRLGMLNFDAAWPKADPKTGLGRLSQAANLGDAVAIYEQAKLFRDGKHVARNPAKAVELFGNASNAGVADATADLGEMYAGGDGVPRDIVKAKTLIQKAIAGGSVRGAYSMAKMLQTGQASPQSIVPASAYNAAAATDYVQARVLAQQAATKGEPRAMLLLATMSMRGQGAAIDMESAYLWLRRIPGANAEGAALAGEAEVLAKQVALAIGPARAAAIDRQVQRGAVQRGPAKR